MEARRGSHSKHIKNYLFGRGVKIGGTTGRDSKRFAAPENHSPVILRSPSPKSLIPFTKQKRRRNKEKTTGSKYRRKTMYVYVKI